jgi:palmitoyltransferase ZDHHC13/17
MLKSSLKKVEKSLEMPIAFLVFFDSIFAILFLFLFPRWQNTWSIYLIIISGMLTMLFWFITMNTDAGVMRRPKDIDFLKLMQSVDPLYLCPECEVIRTPRSKHCNVCNQCIERYDHHCPWVNNCVGIKNHRPFMMFLTFLIITILGTFIGTIVELVVIESEDLLNSNLLNYELLPDSLTNNKVVYYIMMWFVLIITGFF